MLRTLLENRFKLSMRREMKEMPVYELVVARTAKAQEVRSGLCASVTGVHGFSGNPTRLSAWGSTSTTWPDSE